MSAPPPAVEQLPDGNGSDTLGFTVGGAGAVKTLNSKNKTGTGVFDVAAFVNAQSAPLVVVKYEADFCKQCKDIAPLFERLAAAGAQAIACFSVDVGVNEDIGEASEITNLPTFKFFTTKLSPSGELLTIDVLVGANAQSLQEKFFKGMEVVTQLVNSQRPAQPPQRQAAPPPQQQQYPTQRQYAQGPPPLQPQQQQYAQAAGQDQRASIKRELADIRTVLLATVQRVEKLYMSIN